MSGLGLFLFGVVVGAVCAALAVVVGVLHAADRLAAAADASHAASAALAKTQRDAQPPVSAAEDCAGTLYFDTRPPAPTDQPEPSPSPSPSHSSSSADPQPQLQQTSAAVAADPRRFHGLLRVNTLFLFAGADERVCAAAMCVDGCGVELVRTRPTRYHRRNYLRLTAPADGSNRELRTAHGTSTREAFVWCDTGLALERWFEGLSLGARVAMEPGGLRAQLEAFGRIGPACMHVGEKNEALAALNALVHRAWWPTHDSDALQSFMRAKVDKKLARIKKPSLVSDLHVGMVRFGPNLPIATAARLVAVTPSGGLTIDADVEYAGGFSISIEVRVTVSLPLKKHVSVPLVIAVAVGKSSGHARLVALPPPARRLWIGFHEEPQIDLSFDTHVAQHASLSISVVPKVAGLIVARLRQEIVEMMVLPQMDDYPLPSPKRRPKQAAAASTSTAAVAQLTTSSAPASPVTPAGTTPTTSPAPPVPQRPSKQDTKAQTPQPQPQPPPPTVSPKPIVSSPRPATSGARSVPSSPAITLIPSSSSSLHHAAIPAIDLDAAAAAGHHHHYTPPGSPTQQTRHRTASLGANMDSEVPPKVEAMTDDAVSTTAATTVSPVHSPTLQQQQQQPAPQVPPRVHHSAPSRPLPPNPPHRPAPAPPPAVASPPLQPEKTPDPFRPLKM